jgi:hypothetical protein
VSIVIGTGSDIMIHENENPLKLQCLLSWLEIGIYQAKYLANSGISPSLEARCY